MGMARELSGVKAHRHKFARVTSHVVQLQRYETTLPIRPLRFWPSVGGGNGRFSALG